MGAELAVRNNTWMSKEEWELALEQGDVFIKSKMLPEHIKRPEEFLMIVARGRELDLSPLEACSHMFIVNGKVSLDVQSQIAIVYRRIPGAVLDLIESTAARAIVQASRPGRPACQFSFDIEDAKRAGLLGKDIWKKYPKTMLAWRAYSMALRTVFPDAIGGGCYVPGELPDDTRKIDIGEDDEPQAVNCRVIEPPPPEPPIQEEKRPTSSRPAAQPAPAKSTETPQPPPVEVPAPAREKPHGLSEGEKAMMHEEIEKPEAAKPEPAAEKPLVARDEMNLCLNEWVKTTKANDVAEAKALFITPFGSTLATIPQAHYSAIVTKMRDEYRKRKMEIPPRLEAVLAKLGAS